MTEAPRGAGPPVRRLAALWFADIVGFTTLSAADENLALRVVEAFQQSVRDEVTANGGRVVKFLGDGALAEFSSTESAVRAALALRTVFAKQARRLGIDGLLRIGIHVGEITAAADGDIYGDGVNTTARLQKEAAVGSVIVSEDVWRQLRVRPEYQFVSLGEKELRGIHARVGAFSVGMQGDEMAAAEHPPEPLGEPLAALLLSTAPVDADAPAVARGASPGGRVVVARRWRRWPIPMGLGVALLGVGVTWAISRGDTAPAGMDGRATDMVAVLPFQVRGSQELAYLGEVMVDLLSRQIDGTDVLGAVDSHLILRDAAAQARAATDPDVARDLASGLGADLFVMGDIVEAGGRIRIGASLYEANGVGAPVQAEVEGLASDLFPLVDQLALRLLGGRITAEGSGRLTRLAAASTRSLPALRAYLEGERALHEEDYSAAVAAFQSAVAADSLFVFADFRLAVAGAAGGHRELARVAAERASARSADLAPHDRLLVQAYAAHLGGDPDLAERLYRQVLDDYPTDGEAWLYLGEVLYHDNPARGRSSAEARDALEEALALGSASGESRKHLLELAALQGRWEDLETLLAEFHPDGVLPLEWRAVTTFATDDRAAQQALTDEIAAVLEAAHPFAYPVAIDYVASLTENVEAAEGLARLLTRPSRSPDQQAMGHRLLAELALARGAWGTAQEEIAEAAQLDEESVFLQAALLTSLPMIPVERAELEALRARIRALESRPFFGEQALYHGALLSARLGDQAAVARALPVLARRLAAGGGGMDGPAPDPVLLRAFAARWAGRPDEGLAVLDSTSGHAGTPDGRFLRAELLLERGSYRDALRWYDTLRPEGIFYRPVVALRRAEAYAKMNQPEQARPHYAQFAEAWKSSDAALRPLVAQAAQYGAGGSPR